MRYAESIKSDPVLKFITPTGCQKITNTEANDCVRSFKDHIDSLLTSKRVYAGSNPAGDVFHA